MQWMGSLVDCRNEFLLIKNLLKILQLLKHLAQKGNCID